MVKGITCSHCKESIGSALNNFNEIKSATINQKTGQVIILGENLKKKLIENKIKNLGLLYEENDEGVMVFAGPFPNNDIDLKLDFLIKNGYINAKKTR